MSPAFGILVIGDEILTGRRRDRHFEHSVETLAGYGFEAAWCKVLGDDPERLVRELARSMADGDGVFSFGGIGATPDDHTRAAAARAAGLPLIRHPQALALIEERFGAEAYPHRVHMADLPEGATLLPNPVNQVPGFSVGDHHFMPGFPNMAWPMLDWVLERRYAERRQTPPVQAAVTVFDVPESELVSFMQSFNSRFPGLKLSSLPHMEDARRRVVLGLRGPAAGVEQGLAALRAHLDQQGLDWQDGEP